MKKLLALLTAAVLLLAVAAAAVAESADETATYTIYNKTGETVTELYAVDGLTGEQGENYAADGLAPDASVQIVKTTDDKDNFVINLTFKTESGAEGSFPTLHFETVPITLLAPADVASGATQISFSAPEVTATYTIYNKTGETVTELYAVDGLTGEQGENYAADGLAPDASVQIVKTTTVDQSDKDHFVINLTFKTESGAEGSFPTLHFETVPITLLAPADVASGATQISFSAPDAQ